jgi:hypothetical protein
MPIQVSYPGVYVQEIPGGQPTVAAISTASTAFVDFFARGPMNEPKRVTSMQDVERMFGGLHTKSEASYGLRQYFLNGGQEAWIVRTGDGAAKKACLKIKIRTPGLPARVKASFDDFMASKKAAEAAVKAAEAASAALAAMQKDGITDQEREEGGSDLRGNARLAADATNQAAEATRMAAVQAKAASDELALAIAKVAAASGPVADRTAMAAHKAADGAGASSDAAKATADIAAVAQRALGVAEAALKAGANARAASAAATSLQGMLDAVAASKAAADGAAKELENAKVAKDLTNAQIAAERAAAGAAEAAAQAQIAAENAAAAAQGVIDKLKVQKADTAAAQKALDDAHAAIEAAKAAAKEAVDADWDAQTAADLEAGQAAADRASKAAATGADVAEKNAQAAGVSLLATILGMASTAAADAAHIAGKETADGKPEPINPVVFDAIKAINDSIDAAKRAAVAAKNGAQDAKVAADSVTSGIPMLAARAAENSAGKTNKATVEIIQQANATKLQVNSASMKALASVPGAKSAAADADAAAKTPPEKPADGVALALAAGKAGLMAADNATAAAEAIEKAAVATSQVAVQASVSADVAAQAAQAAVFANEEANQDPTLTVEAINEGEWGDNLEVTLTVNGTIFDLAVREIVVQNGVVRQLNGESYSTITLEDSAPANKKALEMVNHNSNLVRLSQLGPKIEGAYPDEVKGKFLDNGDNGGLANADQLISSMYTLDGIEPSLFNLLCLPAAGNYDDAQASVAISTAHVYCAKKRAFLIVDIPAKVKTVDDMRAWAAGYGNAKAYNMAVYFPRLIIPDPLNEYRPRNVGPSGTVAGIYSRTDTARGVWKAPAGIEAVIQGAEVSVRLNDDLNGLLNPLGINVLRSFPIYGQIVWGARTLAGADPLSSEYKYINVRRLMNYVEESVFRSMKWAVFEPNNETLWSKIRLQINGFLSSLFAAGAFQGAKPASAYFVRCDGTTTTPLDIDLGIVNVFVGIAPSKPAEFIILNFQQIAGQSA